jgi:hypothetical protein
VWLFARRDKLADRIFLAVAAAIYIAIMAATIWKFNARESTVSMLFFEILMETVGLILVWLSRKLGKKTLTLRNLPIYLHNSPAIIIHLCPRLPLLKSN